MLGDRARIRQALMRLVNNAIKFTDLGEVTVELGWEAADDGVPRAPLRSSTRDPGIGAEGARGSSAFEQLDGSTRVATVARPRPRFVSRIARASGGTVELDSEPGRGSRFSLLPSPSTSARPKTCPPTELSILVVDDAAATTRCLARTLEALGAEEYVEASTYAGFESLIRGQHDASCSTRDSQGGMHSSARWSPTSAGGYRSFF